MAVSRSSQEVSGGQGEVRSHGSPEGPRGSSWGWARERWQQRLREKGRGPWEGELRPGQRDLGSEEQSQTRVLRLQDAETAVGSETGT